MTRSTVSGGWHLCAVRPMPGTPCFAEAVPMRKCAHMRLLDMHERGRTEVQSRESFGGRDKHLEL